ncbi:MAG: flagellar hook-length control protein FliK [Vicinamibacterales bacterium]
MIAGIQLGPVAAGGAMPPAAAAATADPVVSFGDVVAHLVAAGAAAGSATPGSPRRSSAAGGTASADLESDAPAECAPTSTPASAGDAGWPWPLLPIAPPPPPAEITGAEPPSSGDVASQVAVDDLTSGRGRQTATRQAFGTAAAGAPPVAAAVDDASGAAASAGAAASDLVAAGTGTAAAVAIDGRAVETDARATAAAAVPRPVGPGPAATGGDTTPPADAPPSAAAPAGERSASRAPSPDAPPSPSTGDETIGPAPTASPTIRPRATGQDAAGVFDAATPRPTSGAAEPPPPSPSPGGPASRAEIARLAAAAPEAAAAPARAAAADASVLTPVGAAVEHASSPLSVVGRLRRQPSAGSPTVPAPDALEGRGAPLIPAVAAAGDPPGLDARSGDRATPAEPVVAVERRAADGPMLPTTIAGPAAARDAGPSSILVEAPPSAAPAALDDVLPTQIIRSIRLHWRAGQGEARVQLRPEHLGELTIALTVERGGVTATLHAENADVRRWIDAHSASLRDGLAEQGLRLERLIVSDERPRHDASAERRQQQPGSDDEASRRRRGRAAASFAAFDVPPSSEERTTA